MPQWVHLYVRAVDRINYRVGRFAMYLLYAMMAVLIWSSVSKVTPWPSIWTLEMAQFIMVAYYMLGGPYSLQLDSNVRMDLLYHRWSPKTRAMVDAVSVFALLFYLCVLFYGAIESTAYALGYFGDAPFTFYYELGVDFLTGGFEGAKAHMGMIERSPTAWRPVVWPIKLVMCFGVFLMILQAIAFFFRDLARVRGEEL
ncbi:TRAP transporter small permease subunit [Pseudorhodobacter sp.]|uniref:TRAP transporter small permease subunit n=1 Tax=Pseudorhodobacter sp. TaxID=1934400 RepID=UPI0026473BBB|nr:TRAP transporter small permease subunit [Pseudorhodobacter sp.]MDN5785741.1 TRAP transporter small permease subunit [Pseudorhodobacter sp.]